MTDSNEPATALAHDIMSQLHALEKLVGVHVHGYGYDPTVSRMWTQQDTLLLYRALQTKLADDAPSNPTCWHRPARDRRTQF